MPGFVCIGRHAHSYDTLMIWLISFAGLESLLRYYPQWKSKTKANRVLKLLSGNRAFVLTWLLTNVLRTVALHHQDPYGQLNFWLLAANRRSLMPIRCSNPFYRFVEVRGHYRTYIRGTTQCLEKHLSVVPILPICAAFTTLGDEMLVKLFHKWKKRTF